MSWMNNGKEFKGMAKLFDGAIDALIKIVFLALVIYSCVVVWVLFSPQIKNAIGGDKLAGCNLVLPDLPGVYCQGHDSEGVYYYNSKIRVSIK